MRQSAAISLLTFSQQLDSSFSQSSGHALASAMEARVKQEIVEHSQNAQNLRRRSELPPLREDFIELSDSHSDADAIYDKRTRDSGVGGGSPAKKQNVDGNGPSSVVLPPGFLDPLPQPPATGQACKQFWKAGDYEGFPYGNWDSLTDGMDHVRVHPKFLHSNATSHKWALGAFAELLDNSLDEVCHGATYVNIDMLISKKDGSRMLLIEDNGGGMDPDKLRQCMSLGYSVKGKLANTIGQYGNGFKTSTMRLGADVVVFSRSCGKDSKSVTQSVGLLSYTFLRSTGKEDIVVPIVRFKLFCMLWLTINSVAPIDFAIVVYLMR
ncbi:hypothetical protein Cgig2_014249 [Carnegiea gigantea]|uniref:Uncharacterized protein n=1 Tax=Carnegiea gigantea TaxID=171969 RepID=A0A9Q1K2Q2_9CARY|nr:hypothetical protein Cgig2_014249 [Carnegiea gigantea]